MRWYLKAILFTLLTLENCHSNQDLFRYLRKIFNINDGVIDDSENLLQEYDFVIVGSGSGGSVVANRLSENLRWSVLLLEAGTDETFFSDIPMMSLMLSSTSYSWGYKSEKMKTACLGFKDVKCAMGTGKALGGTSVINFLIYTRGHRSDFDTWANMGNKGWSYVDVLPYFIKSENCTTCEKIDQEYHGRNGYLSIENPHYVSPVANLFLKTGQDLGYKICDTNGKDTIGFSRSQATMKNGIRHSAATAFLKPILNRTNLHISSKTRVTKILINSVSKMAYGVEFVKNKKVYSVIAKKEVILSAGAIHSPHLLMLSGIGPRDVLEKAKVHPIQDLKVGYNLQDHMGISTLVYLVNESITAVNAFLNPNSFFDYITKGVGPLTVPGGAEALGFVRTKYAPKDINDVPDMELIVGVAGSNIFNIHNWLPEAWNWIPENLYSKVYRPIQGKPSFSITPVLLRPKSRGRIIIKDGNPFHWPILMPNYFEDEQDVATMVEGIKMAISIATSNRFQRYNSTLHKIPFPGCENIPFGSDSYWACAVRHLSISLGHIVGTCKMGPETDPDAVVDPQLRVHGIKNLRIVDGSIMPNIIAGHPNAVIYMIGEKASDLIKETWKNYNHV